MDRKKEKLLNILKKAQNPNLVVIDEIERLNDNIAFLTEELKKKEYEYELTLNRNDFVGLTGEKGEMGEKGENGERGEIGLPGTDGRDGLDGSIGMSGKDGKDGLNGQNGLQGERGKPGKDGKDGEPGKPPKHEWKGNWLRFENPDGSWGEWIKLSEGQAKTLHRGGGVSSLIAGANITITSDGNGNYTITSLSGDASTRVLKAGDTMTGDLMMQADIVLQSGRKLIFDGA